MLVWRRVLDLPKRLQKQQLVSTAIFIQSWKFREKFFQHPQIKQMFWMTGDQWWQPFQWKSIPVETAGDRFQISGALFYHIYPVTSEFFSIFRGAPSQVTENSWTLWECPRILYLNRQIIYKWVLFHTYVWGHRRVILTFWRILVAPIETMWKVAVLTDHLLLQARLLPLEFNMCCSSSSFLVNFLTSGDEASSTLPEFTYGKPLADHSP